MASATVMQTMSHRVRARLARAAGSRLQLPVALLATCLAASAALAQSPATKDKPPAAAPAKSAAAAPATAARYQPDRFAGRAGEYYRLVWGVDSLGVKSVESGEVIRFTYRVLDPNKAKALNDKKNAPALIDPRAGAKLVVPQMEKIGQLRQSSTPEAGKSYWMAFSNKGRLVKHGDHVIVQIGQFRADGLVVD
jgi:hypothetical protein